MRYTLRQMKWATQYGIWLGKRRERDRILKIFETYAPHLLTSGLIEQIKGEQE